MINVKDVDSTVSPCHDFYQYANGSWYRRMSMASAQVWSAGPDSSRIRDVLQRFVTTAPALSATTQDPMQRLVGNFYGSCLADTTGTAAGTIGESGRESYCFRVTQDSLELVLITVLLERVWPVAARAQSQALLTNMINAPAQRFRISAALSDNSRQKLLEGIRSLSVTIGGSHKIPVIPFIPFLDSVAAQWDQAAPIRQGYADLTLSPTDFGQNLARLRVAASPHLAPSLREALRHLLAILLTPERDRGWSPSLQVFPGHFIPPRVKDTVDLGGWYGIVGAVMGHEISHNLDFIFRESSDEQHDNEVFAFADEQLKGQLELWSSNAQHPFDDQFGVLLAYDAFVQALEEQRPQRLEGFTPEQRFFLGIAQSWRGGEISGRTTANGMTRWRVLTNGALSTIPAFARAFGCEVRQPMTGRQVWYTDPWYGITLTPGQRKQVYSGLWTEQQFYLGMILGIHINLTAAQQNQAAQIQTTYEARGEALIDSLAVETVASYAAGTGRLLRLTAQRHGDYRAILMPEQQALLDPGLRIWLREQKRRGLDVGIRDLQP